MSPKAKDRSTFTEKDLRELLCEVGHDGDLAEIYFQTIGETGFRELKRRIVAQKSEASSGDEELAAMLGIAKLSPERRKLLEINALFSYFATRKELFELSISTEQASELLKISKKAIHDRIREGKLIGMIEAGSMKLPTFQFDANSANGCVAGLSEVVKKMSGSLLSKISWLTSPNSIF